MNKRHHSYYYSILISFLFTGLLWPSPAKARNLLVPQDYARIQEAVNAAQKGDRILVAQGIYWEQVQLRQGIIVEGGWNRQFTQRDIKKQPSIIDAKGKKGWAVQAADRVILDGFTIRNATVVKNEGEEIGSGIYCRNVQGAIIRNNIIKENEPAGIYGGESTLTIVSNRIVNNTRAGIHIDKGTVASIKSNIINKNLDAGISSKDDIPCRIEAIRNRIFQNGKSGVYCENTSGKIHNNIIYENQGAGIRICSSLLEILNNTIVKNTRGGIVTDDMKNKDSVIKNNIITHNEVSGIISGQRIYSHNLLFANAGSANCDPTCLPCVRAQHAGYEDEESFKEIGHIIANPLFVDPNRHDYHLLPGSPAIDAGDNSNIFNDRHFLPSLGNQRNDLGAYGGAFAFPEPRIKANRSPIPQIEKPLSPVYAGDVVELSGAQSRDTDGDSLNYVWTITSAPFGSEAKILQPQSPKTSLTTDLGGDYEITLSLTDRSGAQEETSIIINVQKNHPPLAYAGEDLNEIKVGDTIQLFGDLSSDVDQDTLAYRWEFIAGPQKSRARLTDSFSASPHLTIDEPGCYILQLIVNDGQIDSKPARILINTFHRAIDNIRHVPSEYPTIQSAVDAARDGDRILVQAGSYLENVFIDKALDLKGVDWPIIDGGSRPGDVDTVKIANLGNEAGKIEGFVITGGGGGTLGHGLNIWNSSPNICNNRIIKNPNTGIGIHGRCLLTGKTEIYRNIISENKRGIGNGLESCAYIHHNYVYLNMSVGIGCRGDSSPRIEHNHIFQNGIGIGMRETALPKIIGNYIYHNSDGIRLSPMPRPGITEENEIIIQNNLIFENDVIGIILPSFNLSKVKILNNTIDSNNSTTFTLGGGVILGWPWSRKFEAVLQNNIITNNKGVGLWNYSMEGETEVRLEAGYNNIWNNEENYKGCGPGTGDISQDPLFIDRGSEQWQGYFLSQTTAGQSQNSPCVDAGLSNISDYPLLSGTTTRVDLQPDLNKVDLGFHYLPADCDQELPDFIKEKIHP